MLHAFVFCGVALCARIQALMYEHIRTVGPSADDLVDVDIVHSGSHTPAIAACLDPIMGCRVQDTR